MFAFIQKKIILRKRVLNFFLLFDQKYECTTKVSTKEFILTKAYKYVKYLFGCIYF